MSNVELGVRASTADVATDNRPLTDQEIQLVRRLLSDPFSFPLEFKTWLVSYLETSDLTLPISATMGLTKLLGISGAGSGALGILPAGLIFPFGGGTAPTGSKLCDGTAYSRTAEARLFAAIGTTYGAPDGSSFKVPDIQERVPIGKGVIAEHDTLGETENLPLGQRGVVHNSSASTTIDPVADHTHGQMVTVTTSGGGELGSAYINPFTRDATWTSDPAGAHTPVAHTNVGPGGARPTDRIGYITLNFIIVS